MIYHVATFKLPDPSKAQEAADALWRLKDVAPGTVDYKVGIHYKTVTPTAAAVAIVGVFEDEAALDAYMSHPVHTDEVAPILAELCDYEVIERMVSTDFIC